MRRLVEPQDRKQNIYKTLKISRHFATFACLAGMRTPVPEWFKRLHISIRFSWRAFVIFAECSLSIMLISCTMLLVTTDKIAFICEGLGSLVLLSGTLSKTVILVTVQKRVNRVIDKVHETAKQIDENPVGSVGYFKFHDKKVKPILLYSTLRFFVTLLAFVAVNWSCLIPGTIWPREDMPTPMAGWFPIDRSDRLQFGATCVLIMIYFSLCSVRDMYVDMVLHILLATINAQIEFMGVVLADIVKSEEPGKKRHVHWWIKQHQEILKTLDELKPLTGPVFFIAHAANTLLLFFNLVRATEDKEVNVTQLVTIIGVSAVMLFHLYLVCTIGDDITKNMSNISIASEEKDLWDLPREMQKYLYVICIYSTKPYVIKFAGGVGALHAEPYSNMVVSMLGYFNTIYQLRNS